MMWCEMAVQGRFRGGFLFFLFFFGVACGLENVWLGDGVGWGRCELGTVWVGDCVGLRRCGLVTVWFGVGVGWRQCGLVTV